MLELSHIYDKELEPNLGYVLLITGPNGVGKGTVCRELLQIPNLNLEKVVRYTTRPKGISEIEDIDYHFVDVEYFYEMIEHNLFLDWRDFGNTTPHHYGTTTESITQPISQGRNVLLDLDVDSANNIKSALNDYRINTYDIFVSPLEQAKINEDRSVGIEILRRRMQVRNRDSFNHIEGRIKRANYSFDRAEDFTYYVVNEEDKLHNTVMDIMGILEKTKFVHNHIDKTVRKTDR